MASHFEFQLFELKNKRLGSIFVHFFSPKAVATALGLMAPLKEPLKNQNPHFRFTIQLLDNKMASHFEFKLFELRNKRLGSIFVHFFSPKAVADCSWVIGTPGRATKKSKFAFSI